MDKFPQSNFEQPDDNREFKDLIKQTIFGDSFQKWKNLFPEELGGATDIDSLVDKYIENMGSVTDLPKEEVKDKLTEFSRNLNLYSKVLVNSDIYPSFYVDAFQEYLQGVDIFKDQETFSSFAWNYTLRSKEKIEDSPARMRDRLRREPIADSDESNAGIYREALEPQVAEAVFELRRKGYGTFQSGYRDLVTGSQFIDFNPEEAPILNNVLNETELEPLANDGLKVVIKKKSDRATLILIPNNGRQSLDFWKDTWNKLASKLPDKGVQAKPPINLGSYRDFTERQRKIKNGEKTYLGYELEYDGNKVIG